MKLSIKTLHVELRKSTECIEFPDIRYFYGPIGSGKSSIARLIDFCLGANINWSPALQKELIAAVLNVQINDVELALRRTKGSNIILASWLQEDEQLQVAIPAREAQGEVVPGTGVEVLSDLIFYLAKVESPKVRRRKGSPDEHLERLSFRDLFRFCYLDQDGMDNSFFQLDSDNYAVKRKSVDTVRYLLGYHQEKLAELEAQLQAIREERLARQAGADALQKALLEAGFDDVLELEKRIEEAKAEIDVARRMAAELRATRNPVSHAVDKLQSNARSLSADIASTDEAVSDLAHRIDELVRHENELQMLSVRFQRTASARTIVGGVNFQDCPRCTQSLPQRPESLCRVCGQEEHITEGANALNQEVVTQDLRARQIEIKDTLHRMKSQLSRLRRRREELQLEKHQVERALDSQLRDYESSYTSQAVESERVIATLVQKLNGLIQNRKLPDILQEQRDLAAGLHGDEAKVREKLEKARKLAFQDGKNIEKLGELFLDCLLRVKFPDVKRSYHVAIDPSSFNPQVMLGEDSEFLVLSFENASSGGMKSLFKTCYALALHRLCASINSELPNLLIIDTATKNVSSIENPEVVRAFYDLVYELASTELRNTQFILIDNEFTAPQKDAGVGVKARHMVNGSTENPPLVPYLVGGLTEPDA